MEAVMVLGKRVFCCLRACATGVARVVILLLLSQALWAGEYYVCTDANGKKLFSQTPCPAGYPSSQSQHYDVPANTGVSLSPAAADAGERSISVDNQGLQEMTTNNRRIELQRKLAQAQQALTQLSQRQAEVLTPLEQTRDGIAGNNANNRRQQVKDQIIAKKAEFDDEREVLNNSIAAYRTELDQLSSGH